MSEVHSKSETVSKYLILLFILLIGTKGYAQIVRWHVPPVYTQARIVSDNLIAVSRSGKWGLISFYGSEVLPVEYDAITPACEDFMLALNADTLKAIISTSGTIINIDGSFSIDCQCPYFSEGLLPVKNASGKWGYMNTAGDIVIACQFLSAYPFAFGLASVRYADGYFVHINRNNQISHLGNGFKGNDILFAGTFTSDESGKYPFALVCIDGVMYKRALDGSRMQFALPGITSISKEISINGCTLKFGEDYRLSEIITPKGGRKYPSQLKKNSDFSIMEKLPEFNTFCPKSQFESLTALDSRMLLALKDRLYGILEYLPEQNPGLVIDYNNIEVNHHTECQIDGRIEQPSSMKDIEINKVSLFLQDGTYLTINRNGAHFNFQYIPDDLSTKQAVTLDAKFSSDNIEYCTDEHTIYFSYKSAFSVLAPQKVSVDSSGYANFNLTVVNESEQYSDMCSIYIDGNLVKKCSFGPNQRISLPVSLKVYTGDEDIVTRTVKIEIHEKACPVYMTSKNVNVERYYINN